MAIRTKRMMLANENSGVPLVNNAANLKHFFSKRGFNSNSWLDERGDVIISPKPTSMIWKISGNQVWADFAGSSSGTWEPLSANKDILIIVSGHRTEDDIINWAGENPTLASRIGSSGDTGFGSIRVRAPSSGQNFGDQVIDDNGTRVDIQSVPPLPERDPPNTGEHFILVGALQRGASDFWHTVTWKENGYYQNDATDVTSFSLGALTFSSRQTEYFGGKFYGYGIWQFDSLPEDFREASLEMGIAWKDGNYNFWPEWGTE